MLKNSIILLVEELANPSQFNCSFTKSHNEFKRLQVSPTDHLLLYYNNDNKINYLNVSICI